MYLVYINISFGFLIRRYRACVTKTGRDGPGRWKCKTGNHAYINEKLDSLENTQNAPTSFIEPAVPDNTQEIEFYSFVFKLVFKD